MKFSRITLPSLVTQLIFLAGLQDNTDIHCAALPAEEGETPVPETGHDMTNGGLRGQGPGSNTTERKTSEDNLFEGDIVPDYEFIMENYGPDLVEELEAKGLIEEPRFAVNSLHTSRLWKNRVNGLVEVPYLISSQYASTAVNDINNAVRELGDRSKVVKFVQRTSQSDYIHVRPEDGCSSQVGRQGGRQDISLTSGCFPKGTIQHEFLHAIGMYHEQSRPDRDTYVTINLENVESRKENNFEKASHSQILGNPYDYGSVMHYGRTAFSKNGRDTITPKNGARIGQRDGASSQDIIDMRLMYQCTSGARSLSQYNSNRCTSDCKCWEGEAGCNGNNNACQGSMVCSNNRCSRGGGPVPTPTPPTPPTSGGKKCNSISPDERILPARFGRTNHCYRIQVRNRGRLLVDTKDPGCAKFFAGNRFRGVSVSNYQRTTTDGMAMYQGTWTGSIELLEDPSLIGAKFEVTGNTRTKTFSGKLTVPSCSNN